MTVNTIVLPDTAWKNRPSLKEIFLEKKLIRFNARIWQSLRHNHYMSNNGNIYWASFRAACYAAVILCLASKINGCYTSHCVKSHNCFIKWTNIAKEMSENYQTNVIVRKIKVSNNREYYDINNTKLLLYREADMNFGSGRYILKMAEYEPCEKHGGSARIYYTVEPKKEN